MNKMKEAVPESNNLVFMGGVVLIVLLMKKIAKEWDDIWIMPNPGDAGSSIRFNYLLEYMVEKLIGFIHS